MSTFPLIPFIILLFIIIIGYSVVGIFLIIRASKVNLKNLYLIGIGLILVTIGIIGNLLFTFGRLFQVICLSVGYLLLAIFIYQTFHKHKSKSYAKSLLILLIILFLVRILVGTIKELILNPFTYYLDLITVNIYVSIIFYWLGWSASKNYLKLKSIDIEPWIKTRYRLIALSAYIFLFQGLSTFLIPWNISFGDPSNLLSYLQFAIAVVLGFIFCVGMIIAWMMPKKLKLLINKKNGYVPSELSEIPEEELMEIIKKQLREDSNYGND